MSPRRDLKPAIARFTHVALPCHDIDAAIDWYERFTPLRLLDRREDADGRGAWLGQPDMVDKPFIVVLVSFNRDHPRGPQTTLGPFAHLGIEVPTRAEVDAMAERGRAEGCLKWEPQQLPPPIGYVCALTDPDGNMVEFSYDQGVYAKVREVWGPGAATSTG
jgi:catechol 2,3-dioxygenase-like lactoylglutathione lyase family enzyme